MELSLDRHQRNLIKLSSLNACVYEYSVSPKKKMRSDSKDNLKRTNKDGKDYKIQNLNQSLKVILKWL